MGKRILPAVPKRRALPTRKSFKASASLKSSPAVSTAVGPQSVSRVRAARLRHMTQIQPTEPSTSDLADRVGRGVMNGGDGADGLEALEGLEALLVRRRTNLRIDPRRPVAAELVERLCVAAQWAPNHHRTWPWRFAALTGSARTQLGLLVAADLRAQEAAPEKIAKAEGKYLRAPLIMAVAVAHGVGDDSIRRLEDRDAVAAGIQNLLLAATAAGLASYWGTGAVLELEAVRALCGFVPTATLIALIYLGYPIGAVPTPPRPAPILHFIP